MPDRLADLIASTTLNGIDFVEIASADQTSLRVHFLNTVTVAGHAGRARTRSRSPAASRCPPCRSLPIAAADWGVDDEGRPHAGAATRPSAATSRCYHAAHREHRRSTPTTPASGSRSRPAARPTSTARHRRSACRPPGGGPAIDYLAKDFASFRRRAARLLGDRLPAMGRAGRARPRHDAGRTAQRRRRRPELPAGPDRGRGHPRDGDPARLGDPARPARRLRARPGDLGPRRSCRSTCTTATRPAGVRRRGAAAGRQRRSPFELGDGLRRPGHRRAAAATRCSSTRAGTAATTPSPARRPDGALPVGRLAGVPDRRRQPQLWVAGHGFAFPAGDPQLGTTGLAVLIDTAAANPGRPAGARGRPPHRRDRGDRPAATASRHPAALGRRRGADRRPRPRPDACWPATSSPASEGAPLHRDVRHRPRPGRARTRRWPPSSAAARTPAAATPRRCTCTPSPRGRLAWLARTTRRPRPETCTIVRCTPGTPGDEPRAVAVAPLAARRRPVRGGATPSTRCATATSAADRVGGLPWFEYDGDDGDSIRFGDRDLRRAARRRHPLRRHLPRHRRARRQRRAPTRSPPCRRRIERCRARGDQPVRRAREAPTRRPSTTFAPDAPQAFRVAAVPRRPRRGLRRTTAEELDWVLDAGTAMRWTGSWLTVFTTAQPSAAEQVTLGRAHRADRAPRPPADRRVRGLHARPALRRARPDRHRVRRTPWALRGEVEAAVLESSSAPAAAPTASRRSSRPGSCVSARRWSAATWKPRSSGPHGVDGVVRHRVPPPRLPPGLRADARGGHRRPRRDHPRRQRPQPGRTAARSAIVVAGGQMTWPDADAAARCGERCGATPPASRSPTRAGCAEIAYRVGDFATFRRALLQHLARRDRTGRLAADRGQRPRPAGARLVGLHRRRPHLLQRADRQRGLPRHRHLRRRASAAWSSLLGYRPRPGIGATGTLAVIASGPAPARRAGRHSRIASKATPGAGVADVRDDRPTAPSPSRPASPGPAPDDLASARRPTDRPAAAAPRHRRGAGPRPAASPAAACCVKGTPTLDRRRRPAAADRRSRGAARTTPPRSSP